MKRFISMLAVVGALMMAPAITAEAGNQTSVQSPQKYVVINGTNLRLRFEPNLNCSWLHGSNGAPTYLPKGTKLPYKGEAGDFYRVLYNNQTLYVAKKYSYVQNAGQQQRTQTPPPNQKYFVVINGTNVRLRVGPGTNYKYFTWDDGSPCYLPKGTYLEYKGEANDFYQCLYQGRVVYISKKFSYVTK